MSQVAFLNNGVIPPPGPLLTLTGNTGGPVPPTAGNINLLTANTTVLNAGNPGTSTITLNFGLTNLILGSLPAIAGGTQNVGLGDNTLISLTSGSSNVALGYLALSGVNTGTTNIGIGVSAGAALANGTHNVAIGNDALELAVGVTETTALGDGTLSLLTSGNNNTAIGSGALSDLLTGTSNTALGINAGTNYTGSEQSNLLLGNLGVTGESHVIRIGQQGTGLAQQDAAFIAGVYGVTPTGTPQTVVINSSGQLGSTSSGGGIITIDGNTGSVTGSTVTIAGDDGATVTTSALTATELILQLTDSNNNIAIGTNSGNNGISGSRNTFVGANSADQNNKSGTDNVGLGFQALRFLSSGTQNVALGSGSLSALLTGSNNVCVGYNSGASIVSTGVNGENTCIGTLSGQNITTSLKNTAVGSQALKGSGGGLTGSGVNVAVGYEALTNLSTGTQNTAVGQTTLNNITTGSYNTCLGSTSGDAYVTGSESSNILINNTGVNNESNVLRIGAATGSGNMQLAKAFICGIDGVNVGSTATVVTEANNQLGTAVITAGTGISVTPGANTITIAATGSGSSAVKFSVSSSSRQNSVTGDGTAYTVLFDNIIFDPSSTWSGNNTFTAPVTGYYFFSLILGLVGGNSTNTYEFGKVVTTNNSLTLAANPQSVGSFLGTNYGTITWSGFLPMTAGDTAQVTVQIGGTSRNISINGDSGGTPDEHPTIFSGFQVF